MKIIKTKAELPNAVPLGKRGENLARQIVFDFSTWRREFGDGDISLVVQRPGESMIYFGALDITGNEAAWTLETTDTNNAGTGCLELQYRVNDVLVKSVTRDTVIDPCLDGPTTSADPNEPLVDQIIDALSSILPIPSTLDVGKLLAVNPSGKYELMNGLYWLSTYVVTMAEPEGF